MPEHAQVQAPVTGFILTTLGGGNQFVNFSGNEVPFLAYRLV